MSDRKAISMSSRLRKLTIASRTSGAFAVAAAAVAAQGDPEDLDNQIDLVGAIHEVGNMRNSLAPFWRAWRLDQRAWVEHALARLQDGDHDYWALASLLGCHSSSCINGLSRFGLSRRCLRWYQRYDLPDVHVAVLARSWGDRMWAPVFEVGYDASSGEIVDVARFRAVLWERFDEVYDKVNAHGVGSYFMRASLPNGSWRSVETDFDLTSTTQL